MPLLIPSGFAQHVLRFRLGGDADPMTVTFATEWDFATDDLDDLQARIRVAWADNLRARTFSNYTLEAIDSVANQNGTLVGNEHAVAAAGTNTSQPLPQNSAVLVQKYSPLVGRKHKGRFYWPGLAIETNVDAAGVIDNALMALLNTAFDNFFNQLEADPIPSDMFILHQDVPGAPAPTPVFELRVQNVIATQRRRLR